MKAFWRALRRQVFTPITPLYLVFGITAKYWVLGFAYLSFRSYLFDPDGVLVWSFAAIVTTAASVVFARSLLRCIQHYAPIRAAKKRYDAYEPGAEAELRAAREWASKRVSAAPFLLATMLFFLAEPPIISFEVWREMQTPLVHSPKRTTVYSPRAELQRVLSSMESRGIFTTSNPDQ